MTTIFYIIIFAIGISLGSFLNTCTFRIPRGISLWKRSSCPVCGQKLKWFELLPLLSFVWLRGKCRYCSSVISWHYPSIEMLAGVLWFWLLDPDLISCSVWYGLATVPICGIIITDKKHWIIPHFFIFWIFLTGVLKYILDPHQFLAGILAMVVVAAILFAAGAVGLLLYGQFGFGGGDLKLGAAFGFLFQSQAALTILSMAVMGSAVVAFIGIGMGKLERSGRLPFGVFLGLAALLYMIVKATGFEISVFNADGMCYVVKK